MTVDLTLARLRRLVWQAEDYPRVVLDGLYVSDVDDQLTVGGVYDIYARSPMLDILLDDLLAGSPLSAAYPIRSTYALSQPDPFLSRGTYRGHPLHCIINFRDEGKELVPMNHMFIMDHHRNRGVVLVNSFLSTMVMGPYKNVKFI